jgi:hypothetical protein
VRVDIGKIKETIHKKFAFNNCDKNTKNAHLLSSYSAARTVASAEPSALPAHVKCCVWPYIPSTPVGPTILTRDYSTAYHQFTTKIHTRLRAEHEVSMSNIRVRDLARQLDMDIVYHMSC